MSAAPSTSAEMIGAVDLKQPQSGAILCNNVSEDERERSSFEWVLLSFNEMYKLLERKQSHVNRSVDNWKPDISDVEYLSETFVKGQHVGRTSVWQMELRRNGAFLSVGLSCLQCLHQDVEEIWTRFDSYIVDFDGKICHSAGGSHFDADNISKFTPQNKLGDKKTAKTQGRCSFWEMDLISMKDLREKWKTLLPRNILSLRLRLTIYPVKPFSEASHLAEYHEPVQLCYTENSQMGQFKEAMINLWSTREHADITFLVEGNYLKAHKVIVTLVSPVFKSWVNEMQERKEAVIEVPNVPYNIFHLILKYLYTQDAKDVKASTDIDFIIDVLNACTQLQVTLLAKISLTRLIKNLAVENFGETALAIYRKVSKEGSHYRQEVKRFFMLNQTAINESQEFKSFATNNKKEFLQLCFEPLTAVGRPDVTKRSTYTSVMDPNSEDMLEQLGYFDCD